MNHDSRKSLGARGVLAWPREIEQRTFMRPGVVVFRLNTSISCGSTDVGPVGEGALAMQTVLWSPPSARRQGTLIIQA